MNASASSPLRLLIVLGVRLYRDGLATFLNEHDGIDVVALAGDWRSAVPLVTRHRPDVVLVELPVAEHPGVIRQLAVAGDQPARVVALSIDGDNDLVRWAEAGVAGYVTRENTLDDLVTVVRSVARGEMPCTPRAAAVLLDRVGALAADRRIADVRLTGREREIVALMERGLSNKEIGRTLCIQLATVKNHVHNILYKMQADNRNDAVALAQGRAPIRGARS